MLWLFCQNRREKKKRKKEKTKKQKTKNKTGFGPFLQKIEKSWKKLFDKFRLGHFIIEVNTENNN